MDEPLEELYFNWLCEQVVTNNRTTASKSFNTLLATLHNNDFVWQLVGDDNRSEDGKELRVEFLLASYAPDNLRWRTGHSCSVLEMLIALARRAEYMCEGVTAKEWFWEFIDNLDLKDCNDASGMSPEDINEFLAPFIWRQYNADGSGGIFPLKEPLRDQRGVELWYQLCDYLVDTNRLP